MNKYNIKNKTRLERNTSTEGELIEQKIDIIMTLNEPITDGAPIIYTERKHGVLPEYNIRTDRWDIALDAIDKMEMARKARKETEVKPEDFGNVPDKQNGSPSEN